MAPLNPAEFFHMGPPLRFFDPLSPLDARAADLGLHLEHLAPALGTVVHDIDLRQNANTETHAFLYELLVARKVIFFRDQDLTPQQHVDFARRFGELEVHPFVENRKGYPEVLLLRADEKHPPVATDVWHSDVTWRPEPSLGSVLLAREVPSTGGDTCWANMEAAYAGLDDETKEFLEGRYARHDSHLFRAGMRARGASEEEIERYKTEHPISLHPVIRTHPDTGHKSIYVNAVFTLGIEGMQEEESNAILRKLCATATRLEYQCRFRWERNSIAFWDNRSAQHYALSDYWPMRRHMERVTIVGDKPA
jgi:taurine dioxygenase